MKEAAVKLGYDKKIWDNDGKTACDELDWEELSDEQKKAAMILGYTEEIWDRD